MIFSISSLFISLLLAGLLILILQFFLTLKWNYKIFRIDFLQVFALIVFIRLLLPLEFINTHTIASTIVLPKIYDVSRIKIGYSSVTVMQVAIVIWTVGMIFMLSKLTYSLYRIRKLSRLLAPLPSHFLSDSVQQLIPNNIVLNYLNKTESPFVLGILKPRIVFSEVTLSVEEQAYIVQHELNHIKNHDVLKKYLVNLLVSFYWWFPLIYLFRKQVTIILEMESDQ